MMRRAQPLIPIELGAMALGLGRWLGLGLAGDRPQLSQHLEHLVKIIVVLL